MASITVEPIQALEKIDDSRYEYVDGQLRERPLPGKTHSDIQFQVSSLLRLLGKKTNNAVGQEWTIAHSDDWLTPDVTVAFPNHQENELERLIAPAFLCVEVISPTQDIPELIQKAQLYESWGVPHVWIIDPKSELCIEYHGNDQLTIAKETLTAGSDISVLIKDIFGKEQQ